MSGSKKIKKPLSIKVHKSVNKEVISAHKTKLSHPKPTKSQAPILSHVSKKPLALPPSSSQPSQKFTRNLLSSHADYTLSPSPSPTESPYCSPIQSQLFDNAPNSERNLYHPHSSDENHQDESLTQEVPFDKEFNPCTAIRHLTTAIKSKFSEICHAWGHGSDQTRDLWFSEFKKYCMWDPQHNERVLQIFRLKGVLD
ncbi:hypothetical protein Ahy_A03g013599 [Arachis hypogaea]|uniref:Uncharacterized protein n=1 Tax=Arachis hypogaea TaxID=3818 RepID=A0A445DVX0_ARAHY|nr:hypothetical protein Ahy_A03g013599 [Arachis hypogaea]